MHRYVKQTVTLQIMSTVLYATLAQKEVLLPIDVQGRVAEPARRTDWRGSTTAEKVGGGPTQGTLVRLTEGGEEACPTTCTGKRGLQRSGRRSEAEARPLSHHSSVSRSLVRVWMGKLSRGLRTR